MGVGIVRGDAFYVYCGARIGDVPEMFAQKIPIGLAVFGVNITLIPDFHRLLCLELCPGCRAPVVEFAGSNTPYSD